MSRIQKKLASIDRKAMVAYFTPEYPHAGITVPLVQKLEKSGVDIIEIGIPFSDPLADGPVIQKSSQSVLESGMSTDKILRLVREIRESSEIPIILMGYANSVYQCGIQSFFEQIAESGADGVILPDVPIEEIDRFLPAAKSTGIDIIPLVSPLSDDARIRVSGKVGSGFMYCVSITGVTGAHNDGFMSDATLSFLQRVKANTDLPALLGFGISERKHIEFFTENCDGFIVGSALIRELEKGKTINGSLKKAGSLIKKLLAK